MIACLARLTLANWFSVIGGLLLFFGVLTALISNRYATKVMGPAGLGVAVLAPEPGSRAMVERERLRARADRWFWVGIVATALGIVIQAAGGALPPK